MNRKTFIFIKKLKRQKDKLPRQTIKALRCQALSGDVEGAIKGLKKIIGKE